MASSPDLGERIVVGFAGNVESKRAAVSAPTRGEYNLT
jgi:hypothetical protein